MKHLILIPKCGTGKSSSSLLIIKSEIKYSLRDMLIQAFGGLYGEIENVRLQGIKKEILEKIHKRVEKYDIYTSDMDKQIEYIKLDIGNGIILCDKVDETGISTYLKKTKLNLISQIDELNRIFRSILSILEKRSKGKVCLQSFQTQIIKDTHKDKNFILSLFLRTSYQRLKKMKYDIFRKWSLISGQVCRKDYMIACEITFYQRSALLCDW